ncbi:TPA: transcriptional regulator [Klebsiella pneumoniae]|uniref:transcriptional regulator n=1 Tax=Klebsiella TaxID=570 RepID=UPI001914F410|nr:MULTISPECIES: transcriptional regulator [Klebsiella]MBX4793961.1 transcriptional regulator [Klebsiella pneumoniae]MDK1976973.1 transcriptional regulator [Klebsiella sp. K4-154]GKO10228.1 antirepressor [Klebsiella pneumoniae]HBT5136818.1 transcriptional regulator [Klebsiella pneumoniae]HBX5003379.1 transcriptional regulator [Klebsiella pneumoniae]
MSNQLLQWRKSSTSDEWKELAFKSGTTPGYLNLVAYGYRNASPRLAQSIELASKCFPSKQVISKESLVFAQHSSANPAAEV